MVNFGGKQVPYHNQETVTLGADGVVSLRHPMVPEGCILEVYHLTATGNNSGAGELVGVGLTRSETNFVVYGELNTGSTAVIIYARRKLFLIEGDQPLAYFAAGNNTEVLLTQCHGILHYLNK